MKKNFVQKHIRNIKPYLPPLEGRSDYKGMLLDFNERLDGITSDIRKAMSKMTSRRLAIYPEYSGLTEKLARYAGVDPSQVLATNGSDQAIDLVYRAFSQKGDDVIVPIPTFSLLIKSANKQGCRVKSIKYKKKDFAFPLNKLLESITSKTKIIVLCNPNNPTGTCLSLDAIEEIVAIQKKGIVFIDEAYYEYSGITAVSLLEKYPNVVITRTLSKAFGLASLRFGYLLASNVHIQELSKLRDPYDVNQFAVYAASAAVESPSYVTRYSKTVMTKSKVLLENFFKQNGITFAPSQANFLLINPPQSSKKVYQTLKKHGVLVRLQSQKYVKGWIRVTVGSFEKAKKFIHIYKRTILETPQKIAFLDRDGTLIHEPSDTFQVDSISKLKFLDGVIKELKKLQKLGYTLVMVSNQDGLGTTSYPKESFDAVQKELLKRLAIHHIVFSEILICPHKQEDKCSCRKPETGLVQKIMKNPTLDRSTSFVCGDRETDKLFAQKLGLVFVSVKTNKSFSGVVKKVKKLKPTLETNREPVKDVKDEKVRELNISTSSPDVK